MQVHRSRKSRNRRSQIFLPTLLHLRAKLHLRQRIYLPTLVLHLTRQILRPHLLNLECGRISLRDLNAAQRILD
jgi:hypothetical protein